ncbi:MAG: hypothetical protein RLY86_2818 [Pseudomonadota bacterium]|jgi:hypothetical protein
MPTRLDSSLTVSGRGAVPRILDLDLRAAPLPPAITVIRSGPATCIGPDGLVRTMEPDTPRLDHDPTTLAPLGLLVEEDRTNLALMSNDLSAAQWVPVVGGTAPVPVRTGNAAAAPDGTAVACLLDLALGGGTGAADRCAIGQDYPSLARRHPFCRSVWMRSPTQPEQRVALWSDVAGTARVVTVTPTWQRFILADARVDPVNDDFRIGLRGDLGTNDAASILVWGAQCELGAFPSSLIPTGNDPVMRPADLVLIGPVPVGPDLIANGGFAEGMDGWTVPDGAAEWSGPGQVLLRPPDLVDSPVGPVQVVATRPGRSHRLTWTTTTAPAGGFAPLIDGAPLLPPRGAGTWTETIIAAGPAITITLPRPPGGAEPAATGTLVTAVGLRELSPFPGFNPQEGSLVVGYRRPAIAQRATILAIGPPDGSPLSRLVVEELRSGGAVTTLHDGAGLPAIDTAASDPATPLLPRSEGEEVRVGVAYRSGGSAVDATRGGPADDGEGGGAAVTTPVLSPGRFDDLPAPVLTLGGRGSAFPENPLNGHVTRLTVWPRRLSDSRLSLSLRAEDA